MVELGKRKVFLRGIPACQALVDFTDLAFDERESLPVARAGRQVVFLQCICEPACENAQVTDGEVDRAGCWRAKLRKRIQRAVDTRFFRSGYDTERTLGGLSAALQRQTDTAAIRRAVEDAVDGTLHPTEVTLWIRGTEPATGS